MLLKLCKNILYVMPYKLPHSLSYWWSHHKILHWKNPQSYDEKIHWLIGNVYDKNYGKYADKYCVRAYVTQCGLERLLIPLLGVFGSPREIPYERLPDQFILKTTHGSGKKFYEICNDKVDLKKDRINRKFERALRYDFAKNSFEYHYHGIKPKIICEELLKDGKNERLTDYKVVCSYGAAKCILVCTSRDAGRDYYSVQWKYLDYVKEVYRSQAKINKPECLNEMLRAAEVLSRPFPLARVDFYVAGDRLYFGEITLTPSGGNHNYLNEKGQLELGKLIILPNR